MKRVLYIHHGQGIGGAPLSLLYLISKLDRNKYYPTVLFLHNSDAVRLFVERGIDVLGPVERSDFSHTKIWWYRWYHLHHILRALKDAWCLWRGVGEKWIRESAPDIVHLNTSTLLIWGVVAQKMGLPVVWHVREPLAPGYTGLRRAIVRYVVGRYASRILPICKNDAMPWKHLAKTKVIYNAVDLEKFNLRQKYGSAFRQKIGIADDVPLVLYLGGLSREKGTRVILEAFARLLTRIPEAHLVIAGYWKKNRRERGVFEHLGSVIPARRFQMLAENLLGTIQHRVHLIGPIDNVPEAMACSTCLVFPATVGHFARPVIEAGCMGIPVIASDLPPLDELVLHEKTGFLVNHKSLDDWAEKLYMLCSSAELCKRMGEAAHVLCVRKFNLGYHADLVQGIYEKL